MFRPCKRAIIRLFLEPVIYNNIFRRCKRAIIRLFLEPVIYNYMFRPCKRAIIRLFLESLIYNYMFRPGIIDENEYRKTLTEHTAVYTVEEISL
jgi:hypothetical protein